MRDVIIVGDGPGGLSAALFLAKKGLDVLIFGQDDTPMHSALLLNYLGLPEISGTDFQATAKAQVTAQGATIQPGAVTKVKAVGGGFEVMDASGEARSARYVILAEGPKGSLAEGLGLSRNSSGGIAVDRDGRTPIDNLYVVGWATRPKKIQAIISAGDGAAAALDILSKEAGRKLHDFDVVEKG